MPPYQGRMAGGKCVLNHLLKDSKDCVFNLLRFLGDKRSKIKSRSPKVVEKFMKINHSSPLPTPTSAAVSWICPLPRAPCLSGLRLPLDPAPLHPRRTHLSNHWVSWLPVHFKEGIVCRISRFWEGRQGWLFSTQISARSWFFSQPATICCVSLGNVCFNISDLHFLLCEKGILRPDF